MADRPIYYGKSKSPLYYGKSGPMYYGAGGGSYGQSAYGGAAYGGQGGGEGQDDASIIGRITLSRVLRVIAQRWLSVFVVVLVGLIVSFAVYRISPTMYEAQSEFTMDMRMSTRSGAGVLSETMPDLGNTYTEVFNTRISDWRSSAVVSKIILLYRSGNPQSTVSDEEIIEVLSNSELELVRNSRIITISLRSKVPALCAALANAYAQAIEQFTDEENKARCDKAVSQIHSNVEKQRRMTDKIAKQIVEFRTANKVDNLRSQRDMIQQGLTKTTTDILQLEGEETQLMEWEKLLVSVQEDPSKFGSLSTVVPRAQEIAQEYRAYQDAEGECQKLSFSYTDNHPEVIAAKKVLALSRQRFLDAASRALLTGRATLKVNRNSLAKLKKKQEDLRNELSSVEQRIVLAESGLGQLEAEYAVATEVHKGLQLEENSARIAAESNNEIVRVGRPANVPDKPVAPNPYIIFGAGVFLSLLLGIGFVLVADNFEDTIIELADIERRMSLKVLAVLPHVRRKMRHDVAKFIISEKYSQFAESVAGLRNLLDSPRYESFSHCVLVISTQPGEGKTITSSSLAIAYAQAGRKTLHVDFDLRRPRLAKIWDLKLERDRSFVHMMQDNLQQEPDFASLVNHSSVPGLDIIGSAAPEGVSPATIFGSAVISHFFKWARANYEQIIIDSPPFGLVGDVVSLAAMADSVIIMCCPDRSHFRPIQQCVLKLTESGANILGVVVNDVAVERNSSFHGHGYGYYHKYGYGYQYGYGAYGPARGGKGKAAPADAVPKGFADA